MFSPDLVLANVVDNFLRRCPRPSTDEEKASRIATMCYAGGGSDTCNLILAYGDDLEQKILEYLMTRID